MRIYKNIIIFLFTLTIWTPSKSQSSSILLDSLLNKTLDSMQTVLNIKSLSAAIQFTDSTHWARATGISSINPSVNVTINDAYLIGSVTKTLTSACILQLADANVLHLDDSL